MSWTNICMESFCFGEEDENGNYPCSESVPSPFCVLNGHCPHLGWAATTEREVAAFVPLRLVIWDRLKNWWLYGVKDSSLVWYIYGKRAFRKRYGKDPGEVLRDIPIATAEDCPAVAKYEAELKKNAEGFEEWFKKARLSC